MAEPIEMLFGLSTRAGPGNHVLDGGQIPHGKGNFYGGKRRLTAKYIGTLRSSPQKGLNRSRCRLGCGLQWDQGITC